VFHKCAVLPCRTLTYSNVIGCEVLTIVGYRFVCKCGERGKVRKSFAIARCDLSAHRQGL
jgi:hypothetical protein